MYACPKGQPFESEKKNYIYYIAFYFLPYQSSDSSHFIDFAKAQ